MPGSVKGFFEPLHSAVLAATRLKMVPVEIVTDRGHPGAGVPARPSSRQSAQDLEYDALAQFLGVVMRLPSLIQEVPPRVRGDPRQLRNDEQDGQDLRDAAFHLLSKVGQGRIVFLRGEPHFLCGLGDGREAGG